MTSDLEELERLARDYREIMSSPHTAKRAEAGMDFFLACTPSTILALLEERKRLREALSVLRALGFGGQVEDERIGWRGSGASSNAHFRCEFCGQEHLDCALIPHAEACPVPRARAALEGEKEQSDARPRQ